MRINYTNFAPLPTAIFDSFMDEVKGIPDGAHISMVLEFGFSASRGLFSCSGLLEK
jgi:hypothetical protein